MELRGPLEELVEVASGYELVKGVRSSATMSAIVVTVVENLVVLGVLLGMVCPLPALLNAPLRT